MKISEALLNKALPNDIEFEAHERVPFFIVDKDSSLDYLEAEEDELSYITELNVVDNFYTEVHDNVIYAKMDSTHRNDDGSFSGAEPTYSNKMSLERQRIWVDNFGVAISANAMQEIRRLGKMTLDERKAEKVAQLKAEKMDVAFKIDVISSAKRPNLKYVMNLKVYNELLAQLQNGKVAFHDDSMTLHEAYTLEEATQLIIDMSKAVAEREAKYDIWITRATHCTNLDDLYMCEEDIYCEDEQGYINLIVGD